MGILYHFSYPDYQAASLEELITELEESYFKFTSDTLTKLPKFITSTEKNSRRLEDAEGIIGYNVSFQLNSNHSLYFLSNGFIDKTYTFSLELNRDQNDFF